MGWIRTLFRYKDLLILLVQRDIKLKYRRSFLGYLWSILNPLLSMLVMAIVFTRVFSRNIENYPVYLICGNILFSYMRESSTQALSSVIDNASLLKKTYVPKYIFTLSKITSSFVSFVLSMSALVIVMIATGVPFRWSNLLIIVPICELYVFAVGLGLFLGAVTVFFRDMKNLWSVVTLAWMYLTPIFFLILPFGIHGGFNLQMNNGGIHWWIWNWGWGVVPGCLREFQEIASLTVSNVVAGLLGPVMSHVCEMQPCRCECFPVCSTLYPLCLLFQKKHVAASETFKSHPSLK